MNPRNPIHDPAEEAALYVAGALPPEEAAALEARLADGDDALAAELASYDAVVLALTERSEPAAPDPSFRQTLVDRVSSTGVEHHGQTTQAVPEAPTIVRRGQSMDWQESGAPGIQFCVLQRDPARNLQTTLLRAEAGARFPKHSHPVVEECYVLEGDFRSHGTTLFAGDYLRSPAGSNHRATYTEGGCLLLVTSEIRGA